MDNLWILLWNRLKISEIWKRVNNWHVNLKLPQKFEVVAVIANKNDSFIPFRTLENMGLGKKV